MKILKDILYKAGIEEVIGNTNVACDSICFDSRTVEEFSLFVAISGTESDGHAYIDQAIQNGAIAIVCETLPEKLIDGVSYVRVQNSRQALGHIASNFYDHPSRELKLVGITGTNGKTTIATLLFELYKSMGNKCGLLSTVVNRIGNKTIDSTHTTADPVQINGLLADMIEAGVTHCFMEVSSHALSQYRVEGLEFDVAVFTNITHDHLDYHKTFDEYIKAKKKLFDGLGESAFALVNQDDFHGEIMVQNTAAKVKTFALKSPADYKAKIIENQFSGLQLSIDGHDVWSKLIGDFNASNLLAIYAVADLLGNDQFEVLTSISSLESVEGRFQYLKGPNNLTAIVDYAHTPDALRNVLKTIQNIRTGNENVITLVGCGGDRDKAKRPEMGKISAEFSDRVILTSDNPRSEDPEVIIDEMKKGIPKSAGKKVLAIVNRREAIKTACSLAQENDIILIAGKGHEKYQEIMGERTHFDDFEEVASALKTLDE